MMAFKRLKFFMRGAACGRGKVGVANLAVAAQTSLKKNRQCTN
jgi:hypothetical protein